MQIEIDPVILSDFKSPEKNLLCSILLRAWADLDSSCKFTQSDAYNWINCRIPDPMDKWSFIWVCDTLGLSSIKIRKVMMTISFHEQVQKLQPDRYRKQKKVHCAI